MTTWTPNLEIIPLQYRPLVRASIHRLADTFEGTFAPEVVERFVLESIEAMDGSKVKDFIPLFAERFAKDRLWSLAKSQGQLDTDLPTVLFLCVHNAGRSQMAAGLLQHLAGDRIKVMSGGSTPGEAVNPAAVAVMAEKGIDIRDGFPKPWTEEVVRAADVVITMGCGDACPIYPGKRYEDWVIDDPSGKDVDAVRPARDEIERRVRALMHELGVTPYDEREPAAARG